jgi:hypothetical protein
MGVIATCKGGMPYWVGLFGGNHPRINQFVYCDGSGRAVQTSVDLVVYEAMATRNQGEVVQGDGF